MMLNVEQRFHLLFKNPVQHDNSDLSVFSKFTLFLINKLIVSVCCVTTAWCGVLPRRFCGDGSDWAPALTAALIG